MTHRSITAWCYLALLLLVTACSQRFMKAPGETDIKVESVTIVSKTGEPLALNHADLFNRLGMRAKSLIFTDRFYSTFREAEDLRRITSFWHWHGYFDVEVDEPELAWNADKTSVAITWRVQENERYKIGTVNLLHAPQQFEADLKQLIPFGPGTTEIQLEKFRKVRVAMGVHMRERGFAHAMVYSRTWVDRKKKEIHWYYFVDSGPETTVGTVMVDGNKKIPDDLIKYRAGLHPGDPYNTKKRDKADWDLLDTGAFGSVFVRGGVDVKFIVPGTEPDTGGKLRDEQIDADGNLVPRDLPSEVPLKIHVVESPSTQFRIRSGVEFDPTRIDTSLGSELWLRNFFGPWHHLVLEGRIGYGWLWRDQTDDPTGVYGEALVRTLHPSLLARLVDLRLTARFLDDLFPGFHLREVTTGPGIRSTLAKHFYFDVDTFFRYGKQINFGPFDAATQQSFELPSRDDSYGGELQLGLIWDERDNPVEPLRGHMLSMRTQFSPGEALGTHRYLGLIPEARGFLPLSESASLGLKLSGGWVVLEGDEGVPLGPRFFGGGAYGFRGFGRHRLSPEAVSCDPVPLGQPPDCEDVPVGGLSVAEGSLEARFLPRLKPIGAIAFVDVGGASIEPNPFDAGLSMAFGVGGRLRIWYLPIALDFAYRLLDESEVQKPGSWDPYLVFFRIGEAF